MIELDEDDDGMESPRHRLAWHLLREAMEMAGVFCCLTRAGAKMRVYIDGVGVLRIVDGDMGLQWATTAWSEELRYYPALERNPRRLARSILPRLMPEQRGQLAFDFGGMG
jgi:hypothetical protein